MQMDTAMDLALPVEEHRPDDVYFTYSKLYIQKTLLTIKRIGPFSPIRYVSLVNPIDDATILS